MHGPKNQGKSFDIPRRLVWDAYLKVRENKGAAGVDGVTIERFEENLKENFYQLWNRMSSGSYFPGAVRAVEIPKSGGGVRVRAVASFAEANDIPWVKFRKDDVGGKLKLMRPHLVRQAATGVSGVVAIGVAQEFQRVCTAYERETPTGRCSGGSPRPTGE